MKVALTVAFMVVALTVVACSSLDPLEEQRVEALEIDSVDFPGRLWEPFLPPLSDGEAVLVGGRLTIPPTDDPVPAVIITHGCGGPGGAERGWVDDLVDAGYAVLLLDSFGGRGISTICFGRETLNVASMVVDVYRAAARLSQHEYIDGSRLAVMGFSLGGRTALWSALDRFQDRYDGQPLQAHIAFYPSTCFIQLENEHEVSGGPIRVFHGTADDWTPIGQCREYVERVSAAGVDAALFAYEGALHSFDNETLDSGIVGRLEAPSPRNCEFFEIDGQIIDPDIEDVAGVDSPCVELGVTYGHDPGAHRAARADLLDVLAEALSD